MAMGKAKTTPPRPAIRQPGEPNIADFPGNIRQSFLCFAVASYQDTSCLARHENLFVIHVVLKT